MSDLIGVCQRRLYVVQRRYGNIAPSQLNESNYFFGFRQQNYARTFSMCVCVGGCIEVFERNHS